MPYIHNRIVDCFMSSWTCQKCGRRFENIVKEDIPMITECPYCKCSSITPF